jgi:hypothetical protein
VICGDSVVALNTLIRESALPRPFVYLDAHWWERLPTAEEVAIVLKGTDQAVIAVDDCFVPYDAGYGYDIYAGVAVSIDLLDLPSTAAAAYPSLPALEETGGRRGTLYVGHGDAGVAAVNSLVEVGLLRPAPLAPIPAAGT